MKSEMKNEILSGLVKMEVKSELAKLGLSSHPIKVKIKRFNAEKDLEMPHYETIGSSGMDIKYVGEGDTIGPGQTKAVSTNMSVEIPEGYEIQVRPRSGLAFKKGITVLNTPGTIDSDYRGEIKVILHNTSDKPFDILPADRIAQIILSKVQIIQWEKTEELTDTVRGVGGFGHTGINDASPIGMPKPITINK